jgi:hypothetical protein
MARRTTMTTEQQPMFPGLIDADPAATLPESTCKGCGDRIKWVSTTQGRAMPLDPDPVPNGNVVIVRDGGGGLLAEYLRRTDTPAPGTPRYQSHFSSCPERARFRRS